MKDILIPYAMQFIGIPYRWGGNSPLTGLDCSGLVLELLKGLGIALPDMAASDIHKWCLTQKFKNEQFLGSLLFFGKNGNISHVAMALSHDIMIEAGGGGPTVTSQDEAVRQNAYVRIRPISSRRDFVAAYLPNYSLS